MKLILIVDDDEEILKLLETFLIDKYSLIFSSDAIDAIKKSKNNNIDLLITDIKMPMMSGKELVEKIKKTNQNIKILFISGYITDSIIDKAEIDNNINFIEKPFNKEQLLEKIENLLN